MNIPNILMITSRLDIGGGPKHIYDLVRSLPTDKVFVAAPLDAPYDQRIIALGNVFLSIPHRSFSLLAFFKIYLFCRKYQIQIIHSHGRGAGLYSRLFKLFSFKVIHTFHGVHLAKDLKGRLKSKIDQLLSPLVDRYICVSEGEKIEALKNSFGEESQMTVIYNGVDAVEANFLENESRVVLGCLARFDEAKGVDLLIKGFSEYYQLYPHSQVYLKIAGDGEEREKYHQQIASLGLENKIELMGATDGPKQLLERCDFYISSSRMEGFPLSVLEALSAGRFCFLSNIAGHTNFKNAGIQHFELGKPFNFLHDLELNREKYLTLGLSNCDYVAENFSLKKQVEQTLRIYLDVDKSSGRTKFFVF